MLRRPIFLINCHIISNLIDIRKKNLKNNQSILKPQVSCVFIRVRIDLSSFCRVSYSRVVISFKL